jgi:hypothetical protein
MRNKIITGGLLCLSLFSGVFAEDDNKDDQYLYWDTHRASRPLPLGARADLSYAVYNSAEPVAISDSGKTSIDLGARFDVFAWFDVYQISLRAREYGTLFGLHHRLEVSRDWFHSVYMEFGAANDTWKGNTSMASFGWTYEWVDGNWQNHGDMVIAWSEAMSAFEFVYGIHYRTLFEPFVNNTGVRFLVGFMQPNEITGKISKETTVPGAELYFGITLATNIAFNMGMGK